MYLDKILAQHREVAEADNRDLDALIETSLSAPAPRGFASRLRQDSTNNLAVIAEIKRRSPSRGSLNSELDPTLIAQSYEEGGASCLSVLTDADFFGGSVSDLQQARSSVNLPVLRKDFTISRHDICDARIMGADCVLLIAAALSKSELTEFFKFSIELGLDALVEVHDEPELEIALGMRTPLIGVNNRNLRTFKTTIETSIAMRRKIPPERIMVAESGIQSLEDVARLRGAGVPAFLVGESLMRASDPGLALRRLFFQT